MSQITSFDVSALWWREGLASNLALGGWLFRGYKQSNHVSQCVTDGQMSVS